MIRPHRGYRLDQATSGAVSGGRTIKTPGGSTSAVARYSGLGDPRSHAIPVALKTVAEIASSSLNIIIDGDFGGNSIRSAFVRIACRLDSEITRRRNDYPFQSFGHTCARKLMRWRGPVATLFSATSYRWRVSYTSG